MSEYTHSPSRAAHAGLVALVAANLPGEIEDQDTRLSQTTPAIQRFASGPHASGDQTRYPVCIVETQSGSLQSDGAGYDDWIMLSAVSVVFRAPNADDAQRYATTYADALIAAIHGKGTDAEMSFVDGINTEFYDGGDRHEVTAVVRTELRAWT